MSKYCRIIKGPVHIGRHTLSTGSLVELNEDYDGGVAPGGVLRKYKSFPRHVHPDVDLFDHAVEPIDFEPSLIYNHAVMLGFDADPRFFETGVNAVLERIYWMLDRFPPELTIDQYTEWYVIADDEAKRLPVDSPRKDFVTRSAESYRKRAEFLERLKKVVETYNAAWTIDNYKF